MLNTWPPRLATSVPNEIQKASPKKRGRPPKFDPTQLERVVHALMDHHDEFSPDDPEWDSQAKLEAAIIRDTGIEAAESTVRKSIAVHLETWRAKAGKWTD